MAYCIAPAALLGQPIAAGPRQLAVGERDQCGGTVSELAPTSAGAAPIECRGAFTTGCSSFVCRQAGEQVQPVRNRELFRESSGPWKPVADESGTTPDDPQPRLANLKPAARGPVHPASGMENARAVRPGPSHQVQRVSHTALDGRPRPPTGCTGIIVLDLDQANEASLARVRRVWKTGSLGAGLLFGLPGHPIVVGYVDPPGNRL